MGHISEGESRIHGASETTQSVPLANQSSTAKEIVISGASVEVDSSVVGSGPPEVGDSVEVDDSVVDGDSVVLGICVVAIIGAD